MWIQNNKTLKNQVYLFNLGFRSCKFLGWTVLFNYKKACWKSAPGCGCWLFDCCEIQLHIVFYWVVTIIYILSLGRCTRFSCTLINWRLQPAKLTISHQKFPSPHPSPFYWMNEPINEVHISTLIDDKVFPCQYIHIYSIKIAAIEYLAFSCY